MSVYDLPHICWLGESDFELRGGSGLYSIWSESAQKGVDFKHLSANALDVAQRALRMSCAKHPYEYDKLADYVAGIER